MSTPAKVARTVEEHQRAVAALLAGCSPGTEEVPVAAAAGRVLAEDVLAAVGLPDDPRHRQLVRSWFAFTEDLVIGWTADPVMTREEVLALATDVLARITAR